MATKGYTTRQEIENYLLITIDPTFYNQVDDWIEQIEAYIDSITGRNFKADAADTIKYYDGDDTPDLLVDDMVSLTELNIGGDIMSPDTDPLLADGDYITYPANKLLITKVTMRGSYFPAYPQRCVKVTGKFGYSVTPPKDVVTSATVLVAGIINYSLNADGEVQSETIGRYSVTYKTEKQWQDFERVNTILDYYKKYNF